VLHVAAEPHEQTPVAEQLSARVASQPTQTVPPLPQLASDGALQIEPAQHPPGQLVALQPLQCPAVQVWPAGQAVQALPPPPHEVTLSPLRQTPAEQQPFGHDVPSQTQVLPTQRWPGVHVAPVPQRQSPVAEQLSDRPSQAMQLEPAIPQAATERVEQVAPLQQPPGHDVPSQTHRPLSQCWPPAHAADEPHAQLPSLAQWSALDGSQGLQAPPLAPQLPSVGVLHTLPVQQPVAHEVASHTHAPPTQRWPLAHGGPLPQAHTPFVEQVSAFVASQALHAAAPVPHVLSERG
jgi:hypothetical protein